MQLESFPPGPKPIEKKNTLSSQGKKIGVFVVDDEGEVASILALMLTNAGFNAFSFTEPIEALRAASSERPDLLVSDVGMPHLSGIELGIKMQELLPACKVLLISGHPDRAISVQLELMARHEFEFLLKPVRMKDLLHKAMKMTGNTLLQCSECTEADRAINDY